MDTLDTVGVVVAIFAVLFVLAYRKLRQGPRNLQLGDHGEEELLPADEAGPTPTGKFRVAQMMRATQKATPPPVSPPSAEKGQELPDPFSLQLDEEKKK